MDMRLNGAGRRRQVVAVAAPAVMALLLASCGGSSSSAGKTAVGSPGPTAAGSADAGNAAIEQFVTAAMEEPTFRIKQALPSAPERGKTIVYLQNDVAQSQTIGSGVRAAAESVGWKYEVINYKSADTSTLLIAMKDALDKRPVAVIFSGAPETIWASMKPAYAAAKVKLVPMYVGPATIDETVVGNVAGEPDNNYAGKVLADWFITNSGGSGKAAIQAVAGFPVIAVWQKAFQAEVAAQCSKCQVKVVQTTVDALAQGTAVQEIVSALQSDQSIKYAFAYNTNFFPGITNELSNAGLSDVKVGGWSATSEGVADIVRGKDYGWMVLNTKYSGWLAFDMVLNHLAGVKLTPAEEILPQQLITKKNATPEKVKTANDFELPMDYPEQFKKLWHVG
jgi:ABC-type sugar transport system substrate-binding protein